MKNLYRIGKVRMPEPLTDGEVDSLAKDLVGNADSLIYAILIKHAKGTILGIRDLYERMKRVEGQLSQRDHWLATVITNLKNGSSPEDVLRWYEAQAATSWKASDAATLRAAQANSEPADDRKILVDALKRVCRDWVNPGDGMPFEDGEMPALDAARAALFAASLSENSRHPSE